MSRLSVLRRGQREEIDVEQVRHFPVAVPVRSVDAPGGDDSVRVRCDRLEVPVVLRADGSGWRLSSAGSVALRAKQFPITTLPNPHPLAKRTQDETVLSFSSSSAVEGLSAMNATAGSLSSQTRHSR